MDTRGVVRLGMPGSNVNDSVCTLNIIPGVESSVDQYCIEILAT